MSRGLGLDSEMERMICHFCRGNLLSHVPHQHPRRRAPHDQKHSSFVSCFERSFCEERERRERNRFLTPIIEKEGNWSPKSGQEGPTTKL